ncbi:MAG: pilus assembly protein [Acidobacteria bacterium]|nr:pilus assembly protein [Acidobacteriota bacterium]
MAHSKRDGQILVMFAVLAGVLLAFMGLVFDGGRIYYEKIRMQAAADAGALAGAWELQRNNSGLVDTAAKHAAKLNGFEHGVQTVGVQVSSDPGAGTVEVIVDQDFPTSFMRVLNWNQAKVRARALAGLEAYGEACVLALDRNVDDALKTNGNPILRTSCGVMSNSASDRGLRATGASIVSATWVGVAGEAVGDEHFTPQPQEHMPPMLDPLAHLAPPAYGTWPSATYNSSANTYECPGGTCVHSNQVKITTGDHTFQPGIHILIKGMSINSGGTITGTGVTFYNVNASGKDHIDIAAAGTIQFSAPTSGPMKGVLFFVDRNSPDKPPGNKIGRGSAGTFFQGALYFPSQHLDWAGNSSLSSAWTMIVANTINISGTADLQQIDLPPDPNSLPGITRPRLIE